MIDDDSTWDGLSGVGTLGGIAAFGVSMVLAFAVGNQQGLGAATKCGHEPGCAVVTKRGVFGIEYQAVDHGPAAPDASVPHAGPVVSGRVENTLLLDMPGMLSLIGDDGRRYVAEVRPEPEATGAWRITFTRRVSPDGLSEEVRTSCQLPKGADRIEWSSKLLCADGKAILTPWSR